MKCSSMEIWSLQSRLMYMVWRLLKFPNSRWFCIFIPVGRNISMPRLVSILPWNGKTNFQMGYRLHMKACFLSMRKRCMRPVISVTLYGVTVTCWWQPEMLSGRIRWNQLCIMQPWELLIKISRLCSTSHLRISYWQLKKVPWLRMVKRACHVRLTDRVLMLNVVPAMSTGCFRIIFQGCGWMVTSMR